VERENSSLEWSLAIPIPRLHKIVSERGASFIDYIFLSLALNARRLERQYSFRIASLTIKRLSAAAVESANGSCNYTARRGARDKSMRNLICLLTTMSLWLECRTWWHCQLICLLGNWSNINFALSPFRSTDFIPYSDQFMHGRIWKFLALLS